MTLGPGATNRSSTTDNGNINVVQPAAAASQPSPGDPDTGPPLQVSMNVTLAGKVWLELDGKNVSVEDARRLSDVLVDVATAAESLQRHSQPPPVTGQTEAVGPRWPDDRGRDEPSRHVGPPPNTP